MAGKVKKSSDRAADSQRERVPQGNRKPSSEDGQASRAYWQAQDKALANSRQKNRDWSAKRKRSAGLAGQQVWRRETYALPRDQAKLKAREFLNKYPKAAYWSEVESWRELPDDVIEFTMRRLPTAD